jgi:hypothetical protein
MVFQTIWKRWRVKALDTVQNAAICGELEQAGIRTSWKCWQRKELRGKSVAASWTARAVDDGGNVVPIFGKILGRARNVPRGTILVLPFSGEGFTRISSLIAPRGTLAELI